MIEEDSRHQFLPGLHICTKIGMHAFEKLALSNQNTVFCFLFSSLSMYKVLHTCSTDY